MANPLVSRERIDEEARKALAATLRKEEDEIAMDASVVDDLGATSIDFLDINFRLENAFAIQLASQLLLDHVEEEVGEGKAIDTEGRITPEAAELLRMYFGDVQGVKAGMYADEIPSLVTPAIIADGVERILAHLPERCADCGKAEWKSEDGAKVVCGGCGAEAQYPDGDTLVKAWIQDVQREKQLFARA